MRKKVNNLLFAIGLMIVCSILTIWFFRYKKWL